MPMQLSPEYVVGLIDGEGSFTVYVRDPESTALRRRRVLVEPHFYVKLVEEDKRILYALKEFFHCGNVYLQRDSRKNHRDCYRFEVTNRKDLQERIIPFFVKHTPRIPSKKHDFKVFCEIVKRIENGEHLARDGVRRLHELKQTMHWSSSRAGNPQARWERQL